MSKAIKLKNNTYLDSSSIITNIKDNEIYETAEFLNGKRVYGYYHIFSETLAKNEIYEFLLPFKDIIDTAWVDLGNSYIENSKATSSYNTWNLGSIANFQFRVGINTKSKLSITPDNSWGNMWTFHINIKFTKK